MQEGMEAILFGIVGADAVKPWEAADEAGCRIASEGGAEVARPEADVDGAAEAEVEEVIALRAKAHVAADAVELAVEEEAHDGAAHEDLEMGHPEGRLIFFPGVEDGAVDGVHPADGREVGAGEGNVEFFANAGRAQRERVHEHGVGFDALRDFEQVFGCTGDGGDDEPAHELERAHAFVHRAGGLRGLGEVEVIAQRLEGEVLAADEFFVVGVGRDDALVAAFCQFVGDGDRGVDVAV